MGAALDFLATAGHAIWQMHPLIVVLAAALAAGCIRWGLRNPVAVAVSTVMIAGALIIALPGGVGVVSAPLQPAQWSQRAACAQAAAITLDTWRGDRDARRLPACRQ